MIANRTPVKIVELCLCPTALSMRVLRGMAACPCWLPLRLCAFIAVELNSNGRQCVCVCVWMTRTAAGRAMRNDKQLAARPHAKPLGRARLAASDAPLCVTHGSNHVRVYVCACVRSCACVCECACALVRTRLWGTDIAIVVCVAPKREELLQYCDAAHGYGLPEPAKPRAWRRARARESLRPAV